MQVTNIIEIFCAKCGSAMPTELNVGREPDRNAWIFRVNPCQKCFPPEPAEYEEKYCRECGEDSHEKFAYITTYANGDEWKCKTCGNVFMWDEEPEE